jgi:hypothetical protein
MRRFLGGPPDPHWTTRGPLVRKHREVIDLTGSDSDDAYNPSPPPMSADEEKEDETLCPYHAQNLKTVEVFFEFTPDLAASLRPHPSRYAEGTCDCADCSPPPQPSDPVLVGPWSTTSGSSQPPMFRGSRSTVKGATTVSTLPSKFGATRRASYSVGAVTEEIIGSYSLQPRLLHL